MMVHRPASKTHLRLAGHLKIEEKRTTYVKVYKLNSKMKVRHVFVVLFGSAKIGQSAILASGKGPRVRLWSQCSQVADDLNWYTFSGLDVSIRSRMRAYSASGRFRYINDRLQDGHPPMRARYQIQSETKVHMPPC